MMSHANMTIEFLAEAINTAAYLRNRSPTVAVKGVTPYKCLFGKKPDVSNLKVFGCVAFSHIPEKQRKKFDENSRKVVFVDILKGQKVINSMTHLLESLSAVEMLYLSKGNSTMLIPAQRSFMCQYCR